MKRVILLLSFFVACFLPNNLPAETVFQGFESGSLASGGWTQFSNNSQTWNIDTRGPYAGNYLAGILYDDALNLQDEWLLSPSLTPTSGNFIVEAYSMGSPYWSDNYSLNLWLVYGGAGGPENVFIAKLNNTWTDEFVWSYANYNLSGLFTAGSPVRIGFQYYGMDGADACLDNVLISYNHVPEPSCLVLLGVGLIGVAGFRKRWGQVLNRA